MADRNTFAKKYRMMTITVDRVNDDYGFEAKDTSGNVVHLDTSPETGGTGFGSRPMQLLLMGLGGCSGIDIISILKKQRQAVEGLSIKVEGEREKGKEPSLWQELNIVFELKGNIDPEKAKRACSLSMEKYCSVAETLRRAGAKISWKVVVNHEEQ
jgi:putative redox protein